ncbi:hypothetical protein AB0A81_25520 [Streptomyces flaveolus]|uniref:Uncharacterized protein n=1 Tax=Streptomyces flaveolus TaxID=67297 RepID=A0ABV1VF25_9ACTN
MASIPLREPQFTQVQLTGPADAVARLMENLSTAGEVIFGPVQQPARGGEVTCTAQMVTHPSPGAEAGRPTASVTVQTVLEVEQEVLPDSAAAHHIEASITTAVQALPGVLGATSRCIAVVGLPTARE